MRTRLLLALVAVPVLAAALPRDAAAQRHRDRDHRRVYVYRDGRGYRDRIYINSHRYKEPRVVRYRYDDRRDDYRYRDNVRYRDSYRYRDEYAYRDNERYRDNYRYRDQYRYRDRDRHRYEYRRRHTNLADLILVAAAEARYRDRYGHRSGRRIRHGVYIDLY